MTDGVERSTCRECGSELPFGATVCPACGWDLTTSRPWEDRQAAGRTVAAVVGRTILFGLPVVLAVVGFIRLRTVGPGPDLATTLRWMVLGDDGRAAELVTLHRAHEIASAAARYAVRQMEAPAFDEGWGGELAPYATMRIRGWIPMLFMAADTGSAPAGVREIYEVRETDGWGRPYRVETRPIPRGADVREDEVVRADLADGLRTSFFRRENPELGGDVAWLRLQLSSAGDDASFGTADDVVLVSYFPVGFTFRVQGSSGRLRKELSDAYTRGRHHFRVEAPRADLVDARLLAEWRLETVH